MLWFETFFPIFVISAGSMEAQERDKGLQEGNRKGVRDILGRGGAVWLAG